MSADGPDPTKLSELRAVVERFATMGDLEYATERADLAARLRVTLKFLDRKYAEARRARGAAFTSESFEHSNGSSKTPRGVGEGDCSNRCSNGGTCSNACPLYEQAKSLLDSKNPLALVVKEIAHRGYAGDTQPPALVYLAVCSRYQRRPMNVHLQGPPAAGKNFAVDSALDLIPSDFFYRLSASSPRALVYTNESFENRYVVLGEADSLPSEGPAASAARSIVEDARLVYEVVETDAAGHFTTRRIVKQGPTGLITTGLKPLEAQMSSRLLEIAVPDDAEQTRKVLQSEARKASAQVPLTDENMNVDKFLAFQRWLDIAGTKTVVVPFAPILARLLPTRAVRMRRDFRQLLAAVKALAFITQRHRSTADGAVVAEVEDYKRARELLAPTFDSVATEGVTDAVRRTVDAVDQGEEVSEAELAARLKLSKSATWYRVNRALSGGWLRNLETRHGLAARLVRGAPMPELVSALPEADAVQLEFDQYAHSNGHSNGSQTTGGVRETEEPFDDSNDSDPKDCARATTAARWHCGREPGEEG